MERVSEHHRLVVGATILTTAGVGLVAINSLLSPTEAQHAFRTWVPLTQDSSKSVGENGTLCVQRIVFAVSPDGRETRTFPNPCSVLEGWREIPPNTPRS